MMKYWYRDQRGFLLPFLAGAIVGPLFFNGFGYNNCPNCGGMYPQPVYQGPIYQGPVYPAPVYSPYM